MDRMEKIEKKINNVQKKFDETTLAMEMLTELKASAKRKFVIIIILVIALIGTNLAWLIRESQFETITEDELQIMEDIDNSSNSTYSQTIN